MSIQQRGGLSRNQHQTPPQNIPPPNPAFQGQGYIAQTGSYHQQAYSQSPNIHPNSPHFPPVTHEIANNQGATPPPSMMMPNMQNSHPGQWQQQTTQHTSPNPPMYLQYNAPRQPAPAAAPPVTAGHGYYFRQPNHAGQRYPMAPFQNQSQQQNYTTFQSGYYNQPQPRAMFNPQYQPGVQNFGSTGQHQIMTPPQPNMVMHQVVTPQPNPQRKKKIIQIKDPKTNTDVTSDILNSASSQKNSTSDTPPSGRSSVDPNQNTAPPNTAALEFQSQVFARAHSNADTPTQLTTTVDTQAPQAAGMLAPQHTVPPPALGSSPQHGIMPPLHLPPSVSPQQMQTIMKLSSTPPTHPPPSLSPGQLPVMPQWNNKQTNNVPVQPHTVNEPATDAPLPHVQKVVMQNVPKEVHAETNNNNSKHVSQQNEDVSVVDNKHKTALVETKTIISEKGVKTAEQVTNPALTGVKDDVQPSSTSSAQPSAVAAEKTKVGKPEPVPAVVEDVKTEESVATAQIDKLPDTANVTSSAEKTATITTNLNKPTAPDEPEQGSIKEDTAIRLKTETETMSKNSSSSEDKTDKPVETLQKPAENESGETKKDAEMPAAKVSVNIVPSTPPFKAPTKDTDKPQPPKQKSDVSVNKAKQNDTSNKVESTPKKIETVAVNGTTSSPEEVKKDTKTNKTPPTKTSSSDTNAKGDKVLKKPDAQTQSKPTKDTSTEKEELKPAVKYDSVDQWSPLNQSGKKQYNTNFLLQFQYNKTSMEKPKDLPKIDCVLEQPRPAGMTPPHHPIDNMGYRNPGQGTDFTPNFIRHQHGGGQNYPGRQNSRGGNRRHMGPQKQQEPRIIIKTESVELKKAENAWKPPRELEKGLPEHEKKTAEVLRAVRAILNKLTPSKFDSLMNKVLDLEISTTDRLTGVIDLIFEKAIDEPNFSEAYAKMCRGMVAIKVKDNEGKPIEFRKLLLTKCQKEFERDKTEQIHLLELKTKYENETDKDVKKQRKEEYAFEELKDRRRTLGNIRFIGELFKLKMLTENIMHSCILQLFHAHVDDKLESLCRLLTTIGRDLDHQKGKMRMDQYFDQMQKLSQAKRGTISSRVRFMLQDVIDLRKNNWIMRAVQQTGPKTINQIHQDAKQEQEQLQLKMATAQIQQQQMQSRTPQNRGGGRMGSRGSQGSQQNDMDGWTNVGAKQKPMRYDPSKMKISKPNTFDEKTVTLGPQQGFGGWRGGSGSSSLSKTGSGGYSTSEREAERKGGVRSLTPTMMNRFSALQQQQSEFEQHGRRPQPGRQTSREGSRSGSRGSMGPPSMNRTPRNDERRQALETTKKLTSRDSSLGQRKSSREPSPSMKLQSSAPVQSKPSAYKEYTTEVMQKKTKSIISEFLSILDYKEALECVAELNASPESMSVFVAMAMELTLEKKQKDRVNTGKVLAHLLKNNQITAQAYLAGVAKLLEQAIDLELDVPKVWEYYGEQLAPVFIEDASSVKVKFSDLQTLAQPFIPDDMMMKGGVFIVKVMRAMEAYISMEMVMAKFDASGMRWADLLNTDSTRKINMFLDDYGIKSTKSDSAPPIDVSKLTPQLLYVKYLEDIHEQIRVDPPPSCNTMFDWVEKNIPPKDRTESPFLQALTTAVCKNAIKGTGTSMTVDPTKFCNYTLFMKKYLEGIENRELDSLYAIQKLNVDLDQPPNVLKKLFELFYDEEIIQETSYWRWKDDSNGQEGHGVAVAAVNPFYTWLKDAEAESE